MATHPYIDIHSHRLPLRPCIAIINPDCQTEINEKEVLSGHYFSCGIHPWDTISDTRLVWEKICSMARIASCLAIGECGMDKLRGGTMALQQDVFAKHIDLSEQLKKPLIIHCVRAWDEIIKFHNLYSPAQPWIIHGFNKTQRLAERLLEAGMILSFGNTIMNARSPVCGALEQCPPGKFFLETDDQETDIGALYMKASEIRGVDTESLKQQIAALFSGIFHINTEIK